jgi:hypothetical protein
MIIAGLFLLTSIPVTDAATLAGFRGAAWNPVLDKAVGGCARGSALVPHWSRVTGNGTWRATGNARTCPRSQGGATSVSYADAEGELTVQAPVYVPAGRGGVNISWNIDIWAVTAGRINGSSYCPTQTTISSVNYGFSWFNTTYTQAYCAAMSEIFMVGAASVIDRTTGVVYYPSNYWYEPYNVSGIVTENYSTRQNWSNASYWVYNSTVKGNVTYSYGSTGNLTGTYRPQWFVNGTFSASDRYLVSTYVDIICDVNVNGFGSGKASASIHAEKAPRHWDLMPFSIW